MDYNKKLSKEKSTLFLSFTLFPLLVIFLFGSVYSYSCERAFLDVFLKDPMEIFIQNLVTDNLAGENRFFALKRKKEAGLTYETDINEQKYTFGRIIRKIDDNRFLVEVISPSGKLKQEEMTVEIFIKSFVEDKDIPSDYSLMTREDGVVDGLVDFKSFGSREVVNRVKEEVMDDSNSTYDLRELELNLPAPPSKEAIKQYFENTVDGFVTIATDITNKGFREDNL